MLNHLKSYSLFESVEDSISIIQELNRNKNAEYSLDQNGLVNVTGNVNISRLNLKELPVKFGKVTGYFYCYNNNLTSLEGCPVEVGGSFVCANNKLTSLAGSPTEVGGGFYCANNKLTSLVGSPIEVGGNFDCANNQLTTLEGGPTKVDGSFYCNNNPLHHIGHLLVCKIKGQIYADQKLLDEYNILKNQEIEL